MSKAEVPRVLSSITQEQRHAVPTLTPGTREQRPAHPGLGAPSLLCPASDKPPSVGLCASWPSWLQNPNFLGL